MSNIRSHSLHVPSSLQLLVDGHSAAISNGPTLSQLVNQRPQRARFFEQLGLSYCNCGDSKNLEDACRARGLEWHWPRCHVHAAVPQSSRATAAGLLCED